jgi:hypothetical protein
LKYLVLLFLCFVGNFLFALSPTDSLTRVHGEVNLFGILTSNQSKKNVFYAQFLGDTPTFGIGYRRIIIDKSGFSGELGFGFGFMPHLFNQRINPKPKNLIYSHSLVLVRKNEKFLKPFMGYSGIIYSGIFYQGKMYNYIPSPNIGLRLGKGDDLNFNISWYGHINKRDVPNLQGENKLETIRKTSILSIPAFSVQLKF